jgi:hypothetical protein
MYTNYTSSHDILSHFVKKSPLETETEPKPLLDRPYYIQTPSPEVPAVTWVLKTSTDPHVIHSAAQMVVGLRWPSTGDFRQQMSKLFRTFLNCWSLNTQELINMHHAVALGRAYCSLHCVHPKNQMEELVELLPSSHSDPDVNSLLCILQGKPHLLFDSGYPRTLGWALHVTPSFQYRNSEDRLIYFLTRFNEMPLDLDRTCFAQYLCVISFLDPMSHHDLVCMNFRLLVTNYLIFSA